MYIFILYILSFILYISLFSSVLLESFLKCSVFTFRFLVYLILLIFQFAFQKFIENTHSEIQQILFSCVLNKLLCRYIPYTEMYMNYKFVALKIFTKRTNLWHCYTNLEFYRYTKGPGYPSSLCCLSPSPQRLLLFPLLF